MQHHITLTVRTAVITAGGWGVGGGGRYLVSGDLLLADCVMPCADLLLLRKSPLADLHAVQRRERTEQPSISEPPQTCGVIGVCAAEVVIYM